MKRAPISSGASPHAAPLFFLLAACGGSSGIGFDESAGGGGNTIAVAIVERPAGPLALLDAEAIAWRADRPVSYSIELRRAGAALEVLENGQAEAGERIDVVVHGSQLAAEGMTVVALSASDALGAQAEVEVELEPAAVDQFRLGVGVHNDLTYDATREELLIADIQTGYVQILDADPDSPSYGQVVAILPPGPDVGPLAIDATADGQQSFSLNRSTLLDYDLATLQIESNQYIQGGFEPTSLATTPDSTRAYIGYAVTLLFRRLDLPGRPAPIQSVGVFDGRVEGGDVALSPDGALALYAWFGGPNRLLWIIDADTQSATFHQLLAQKVFAGPPIPEVFGPAQPRIAVAPSGAAAFVGSLSGLSRVELAAPDFPITAERSDLAFTGVASVAVDGNDFVLLTGPQGTLQVLDADLHTLGAIEFATIFVDRSAVDPTRARLFLVAQQQASAGDLLVIPLR